VLVPQNGPSPGADDGLAPGATIGRYVVRSLVGRGAMGEVYLANDPELNRDVAIKLLRARTGEKDRTERDRLALMREAQAIARLSHPNVVVIHDVGRLDDRVFIAMEFVDGNTLRYWMLARQRSWQEVLKVFARAGAGLAAAHEKELVHRDFKPDNVMIRNDGQVRVMDFGLARSAAKQRARPADDGTAPSPSPLMQQVAAGEEAGEDLYATRVLGSSAAGRPPDLALGGAAGNGASHDSGRMGGTPAYMAPEQFQGAEPDARGDQFSFCVSLYEALYGEEPFRGNTVQERASSVSEGRVAEPPPHIYVPRWIRKVLLRGLAVDPDERWPSMKDLLARLDENARRLAEMEEWLAERGAGQAD
jgi:eukaryotic-like serine/threonine-protein kinase